MNYDSNNKISQVLNGLLGLHVYSRNQKVGSGCDIVLWYHRKIGSLIVGSYCRYLVPIEDLVSQSQTPVGWLGCLMEGSYRVLD